MPLTGSAHEFHPLTVLDVRRETPDAVLVTLALPETARQLFAFKPGQHIAVRTVLDGQEQRRTYSICSSPVDPGLAIGIKRVPGGLFSNWANDVLAAGQELDAMPPAGRFILPESDGAPRNLLAVAAGAGITPIIAMIEHALRMEPDTRVTLIYGNRSLGSIMFSERLEALKDRHLDRFTLLNVLSRNEESDVPLLCGRITGEKLKALAPRIIRPDDVHHAFLCGPGTLIRDARNALFQLGLKRETVHHEFFAAGGGAFRQPAAVSPQLATRHVVDAPLGCEATAIVDGVRHTFRVPPGTHVVDAALAAGIRVPYSCRGGMCCTCRARVVEGAADMTANYSLEPWEIERGYILTCQAVPRTPRLVVDYDQM